MLAVWLSFGLGCSACTGTTAGLSILGDVDVSVAQRRGGGGGSLQVVVHYTGDPMCDEAFSWGAEDTEIGVGPDDPGHSPGFNSNWGWEGEVGECRGRLEFDVSDEDMGVDSTEVWLTDGVERYSLGVPTTSFAPDDGLAFAGDTPLAFHLENVRDFELSTWAFLSDVTFPTYLQAGLDAAADGGSFTLAFPSNTAWEDCTTSPCPGLVIGGAAGGDVEVGECVGFASCSTELAEAVGYFDVTTMR